MSDHEEWCGINCQHEDCGVCTCPRMQRGVPHPHYDLSREGQRAMAGLWNTRTASSGRFDDAKRDLNRDLRRVRRSDGGLSEYEKRYYGMAFIAFVAIACVFYLSIRGVR